MDKFIFSGEWENIKHKFEAFAGFQNRFGDYDTISNNELSDGTVYLNIQSELNESYEPSDAQIATINYIERNGDAIKKSIYGGVEEFYLNWKDKLDPEDEFIKQFNSIKSEKGLYKILGISRLFVSATKMNDLCIYGMEGGWSGDPEHGLGILMHKDNLILLGTQDDMILPSPHFVEYDGNYKEHRKKVIEKHQELRQMSLMNPNNPLLHRQPKYYPKSKDTKYDLTPSQKGANEMFAYNAIKGGYIKIYVDAINSKFIHPVQIHLKTAVEFLRVDICEYFKQNNPQFLELLDKSVLDKTIAKYHLIGTNYNMVYLKQVDEMVDWLKLNIE